MKIIISWRGATLGFIALTIAACAESPVGQDRFIEIDGRTANFDGLKTTLIQFNHSWAPRKGQGPVPDPDSVFVTLALEIENESSISRWVRTQNFQVEASGDDPREKSQISSIVAQGREPKLESQALKEGEQAVGWLTFQIPKRLTAETLLWSPSPGTVFAVDFPLGPLGDRIRAASVFGWVTSPDGDPVPGASISLTVVQRAPPHMEEKVGGCIGHPQLTARSDTTDETGRYAIVIFSASNDPVCIDLQVLPPQGSGLGNARAGGVTVVPRDELPELMELPELRIDVVLPNE